MRAGGGLLGLSQPIADPVGWERFLADLAAGKQPADLLSHAGARKPSCGRRPNIETYRAWVADEPRRAREAGKPRPRLPDYNTLRRHFGGWPAALAAAPITDLDLTRAALRWTAAEESEAQVVPLDDAGPFVLDGAAVRRWRLDRGGPETELLDALDVSLSAWRRWLSGKAEIHRRDVETIASALSVPPSLLVTPPPIQKPMMGGLAADGGACQSHCCR